jgi:DNA modification methylase
LRPFGGHRFQFVRIAEQLFRITANGGIVAWEVADAIVDGCETGTSAKQRLYFQSIGFRVWDTLTIFTNNMRTPCRTRYGRQHRYVYILSKGKPRAINIIRDRPNSTAGDPIKFCYRAEDGSIVVKRIQGKRVSPYGRRGNVWFVPAGGGKNTKDRCAYKHPAIMSEVLAEDLIISFSRPGDLVFDPMCGSGTTCKMALLNGRRYLGFEIVPKYCEVAWERLAAAKKFAFQRLREVENA